MYRLHSVALAEGMSCLIVCTHAWYVCAEVADAADVGEFAMEAGAA